MSNRLALGCAQFGSDYGIANRSGQVSHADGTAILEAARAAGIDTLDTASAYGDSEECLGAMGVDGWQIISKLPVSRGANMGAAEWARSSVEKSLSCLRVGQLFALLVHRPQMLLSPDGPRLYAAIRSLKEVGLVEKIGVSVYDPVELDELLNKYEFDIVQCPFNVLDQRLVRSGWLQRLADRRVEVHVRSIYLQGLLLMGPRERPSKFSRWEKLLQQWDAWLSLHQLSAVDACLRHALSFPEISKVIVGCDNRSQLDQAVQSARGNVPAVPPGISTDDVQILNPSNWPNLPLSHQTEKES